MEILNIILQYSALGAIVGGCVGLYLYLKQKNLLYWVLIAVEAWEMYYFKQGKGSIKKLEVLEFLGKKFPKVDMKVMDVLIEQAVFRLKHQGKEK